MTADVVEKLNQLFDETNQAWFDVYRSPGVEGQPVTATVPREDRQVEKVRGHLLRSGATLPCLDSREQLAATVAVEAPVVRRAAHMGWREKGSVFVTHRHVAGNANGGKVVPPESTLTGVAGEKRGTLKGWRDLVRSARYSTAMTISLCAVFAAPLLSPLNAPSFALVLVGPSRSGKSTAQLVAASALGFGEEKSLPTLNATPAGLIAAAQAFSDHMLPINEIGTARGPKRDIGGVLRETTYALMTGHDVIRHPSWTGGGSPAGSFQVLPLLSSEWSPDAWAARNGETRDDGETARLIGVPVLRAGHGTVFDRPPKELKDAALDNWIKARFRRLRRGLRRHRGVAFPIYLDKLVADRRALTERARQVAAEFEARHSRPSMSPVARDIVGKFGMLLAGGVIANELGVLPLSQSRVGKAVARSCRAALAELPDPEADLRADLRLLKERLSGGALLDLESCSGRERRMMRNADGFCKPRGQGKEFVIRAQVFGKWFGTPLQTRRTLEWLDSEGFLDHAKAVTKGRSNEWAQKQIIWPDDTRQRSISLFLPAGLADLERDG